MAGRPTKLNEERQARIVQAIRAGNYLETAAHFAGVSPSALHLWMSRGRTEAARIDEGEEPDANEAPYLSLMEAVESARAESEVRAIALIQRAANDGTWQAAAWYLERSAPHRWGRLQRAEISGPQGGPIATASRGEEALVAALERFVNDSVDADGSNEVDGPAEGADS